MLRKMNPKLLLYSIVTCFLMSGGIQIMLFSICNLFDYEILQSVDTYIFDSHTFLGDQLFSFWAIYGLLLILFAVFALFQNPKEFFSKEIEQNNALLTYFFLTLSIASFVPFVVCLLYYLIHFDTLNLERILLFSDGAVSVFLKLWIITIPLTRFLQKKEINMA